MTGLKRAACLSAVIIVFALILSGCGEEKVYHEPGTVEEPYKAEEYEENGLKYRKENYLGYEITYPVIEKNIADKIYVQGITYKYMCCAADYPTKDPNDKYDGEPFTRYIYHKPWSIPEDIKREGLASVTYTVYNRQGSFVKVYQQGEVVKPKGEAAVNPKGGYSLVSSCTVDADYDGELYLCTLLELYGNDYEMTDEEEDEYIIKAFDGTFIGVRADYDSCESEEAYYSLEYNYDNVQETDDDVYEYSLYRLILE
mgnify:CR=1 FL=1